MKSLTLKELLDKLMNFNLLTLKKFVRPLVIISASVFVAYGGFHIWNDIQEKFKQVKINELEIELFKVAKESYQIELNCFNEVSGSRENLEFYLELESCLKSRKLTDHEVKVHKANWADPFTRVINFLDSSYYKIGPEPQRCTYDGNSMIACNSGHSYVVEP